MGLDSVDYKAEKVIGSGTFGVVYKAADVKTGEIVAVKKVFQDKRYKNRELQIMQLMNHPHIISLKTAFYTRSVNDSVYLNLVMNYMPDSLDRLIKMNARDGLTIPPCDIKAYTFQLLRSLLYLSAKGVSHRDIKPHNILVDTVSRSVQICDMGSAKLLNGEPSISYICSRFYRAPELILGATEYTTAIDMWSIGCVVAEMILLRPIFAGETSDNQMRLIVDLLGYPSPEELKGMNVCENVLLSTIGSILDKEKIKGGVSGNPGTKGMGGDIQNESGGLFSSFLPQPTKLSSTGILGKILNNIKKNENTSITENCSETTNHRDGEGDGKIHRNSKLTKLLSAKTTDCVVNILERIFELDPTKRISPATSLVDTVFDDLRTGENGTSCSNIFSFTPEEIQEFRRVSIEPPTCRSTKS